jgi:hypothetical protein
VDLWSLLIHTTNTLITPIIWLPVNPMKCIIGGVFVRLTNHAMPKRRARRSLQRLIVSSYFQLERCRVSPNEPPLCKDGTTITANHQGHASAGPIGFACVARLRALARASEVQRNLANSVTRFVPMMADNGSVEGAWCRKGLHTRRKLECKECGGSQICEHKRRSLAANLVRTQCAGSESQTCTHVEQRHDNPGVVLVSLVSVAFLLVLVYFFSSDCRSNDCRSNDGPLDETS